jgi:hypothetical protein
MGARAWGLLLAAEACGLLAASVFLPSKKLTCPLRAGVLGASVTGLLMVVLGAASGSLIVCVVSFTAGFGMRAVLKWLDCGCAVTGSYG